MRPVQLEPNIRPIAPARAPRRWLLAALMSILLSFSVASARDSLMASAYAPVVADLMEAFQAEETLCPLATYQHDLCFEAKPAGATWLAEQLAAVVADYAPADLRSGDWRSANGVWSVALSFGEGDGYGWVEVFLAETGPGAVRGTFVFHEPR